ncbi:MAG: Nif3-like dinuclear metal center hexameric protein [Lentisphaeria bacterium]
MVTRKELCNFLDELLDTKNCEDVSNNGLQVEGAQEIKRVVFGVDACMALFEKAAEVRADFVFVHHGLSWKDSLKYLTGLNARRVGCLFDHNISLYAAHLPLDRHEIHGHNKCISDKLGLLNVVPYFEYNGVTIGFRGELPQELELDRLTALVNKLLQADARSVKARNAPVKSVGIVSGGAADAVEESALLGLDCFITGEMDHAHYHAALESGIDVISAGHYRTEVPGVKAVMELLSERFNIECDFVDIPTGF